MSDLSVDGTTSETATLVRLAQWRPRLLLALWAVVAAAYLAIFVIDLGVSFRLLSSPCTGPDCHYQAITASEARVLAAWGASVPAYALYMLAISVLPVLLFGALAVVMLSRLYPQPRAFLYSLALVILPVATIASFDVVIASLPLLTIPIQLMVVFGHLLFMSFFLVFPRSRFEPRWTIVLTFVAAGLGTYSAFFGDRFTLPIAQPYALLLLFVAAVIIYRYRRLFDKTERRQTKWVVLGLLLFFAGVPLWSYIFETATPAPGQETLVLILGGWTLLIFITLALPASIFIAIFRHRLWDIDVIINRTLVYGGLSAGIIAVYTLVVGGLGALLQAQGNFLLTLLAAALIAILFQPARERLQRAANRLLFGERDDPYAVLSRLGEQVQETSLPEQALLTIATGITEGLKLPYAAIEVETAGGDRRTVAARGRESATVQDWPLRYQGQVIGRLAVAQRSAGEPFTERETQLLANIASQAGAAAYAARLSEALQRSRERLVLAREEERRRIRRDLHDELGPALASQTFRLDAAIDLLGSDPAAAAGQLQTLKRRNQELVGDIRRLVFELRPPALDELGIQGALSAHFRQTEVPLVSVSATPDPLPPLPAAVEVAAYRIALEAVNNVLRHAAATNCVVTLAAEEALLTLTVMDDGVGLSAGTGRGIGLRSMQERAEELGGTLTVETAAGRGVRVVARLPMAR